MIIRLSHKLFSENPDKKFARKTGLPEGVLTDLWRMREMNGLDERFVLEWLNLKYNKQVVGRTLRDYLMRVKVYKLAKNLIEMGVHDINIAEYDAFAPYRSFILREINCHHRYDTCHDCSKQPANVL